MLRKRTLLPLLLSSLAVPAAAGEYSVCLTAADSVSCVIEQAEFTRQRNAEIDASIATVARARAFEQARNAEIEASIAAVNAARSFERTRNEEINASIATVQRARAFEKARNAEIEASIAAVNAVRARQLAAEQNALATAAIIAANAERDHRFAAAQNALAEQSVAAVKGARKRNLALRLSHCRAADDTSPRCAAERARKFAARQNALAALSIGRVKAVRAREFAAHQNALATFAMHAADTEHARVALNISPCAGAADTSPRCATEQAQQFALSLTHCKSADDTSPRCDVERIREFAVARNREIDAALAAYQTARSMRAAETHEASADIPVAPHAGETWQLDTDHIDTGALGIPAPSLQPEPERTLNHRISAEPCRAAGQPLDALQFAGAGVAIDDAMKPALDRLASIARACPGVRIELHGHSDAGGSVFIGRMLSQARAQSAADYLIGAGIAANRLAVIGHGALEPLVPNTNEANRARNRRIEFSLKDPALEAAAARVMWDLAELLDPTYVPAVARLSP